MAVILPFSGGSMVRLRKSRSLHAGDRVAAFVGRGRIESSARTDFRQRRIPENRKTAGAAEHRKAVMEVIRICLLLAAALRRGGWSALQIVSPAITRSAESSTTGSVDYELPSGQTPTALHLIKEIDIYCSAPPAGASTASRAGPDRAESEHTQPPGPLAFHLSSGDAASAGNRHCPAMSQVMATKPGRPSFGEFGAARCRRTELEQEVSRRLPPRVLSYSQSLASGMDDLQRKIIAGIYERSYANTHIDSIVLRRIPPIFRK